MIATALEDDIRERKIRHLESLKMEREMGKFYNEAKEWQDAEIQTQLDTLIAQRPVKPILDTSPIE